MIVLEYSGVDKNAALVLDKAGPQGSLNGAWASEALNGAAGALVLMGIVRANGGGYTAGPGFTIRESYLTTTASKFSFAAFDHVLGAAQTGVSAGVSWTGTFQATGAVVSFKPTP
jgi:hypothetical protein